MKKLILSLALLSASIAGAATVSVSSTISGAGNVHGAANTQVALKDAAGNVLPAGMRVRLGFFTDYTSTLDATLKAPGGVFTLMNEGNPNRFIPIGEAPTRPGYGDDTTATNLTKLVGTSIRWSVNFTNVSYVGAANDTDDDNTLASGGLARGTRLFLLVYNTASLNPDINASGFEYGLFTAETFLVPQTGIANLSIAVANIDTNAEVLYGKLGNSLHLAGIVPEPSTSMMALLAGLGLVARRRR